MFLNYLKIALKNLIKGRLISLINISGLAVGMAVCILIFLWVQNERRVDQFHDNIDNLYLVGTWVDYSSYKEKGSGTPPILGPVLEDEYPEILNSVRFANGSATVLTQYGDVVSFERMALADPSVFEMFNFPFVLGNPQDAFDDPHVIVLNESMAQKYFGEKNPVGEIITLDNRFDMKVVGVMKNIPYYSTIEFQFWLPFEFLPEVWNARIDTWYNLAHRTYVELDPNARYQDVSNKISGRIKQSFPAALTEPYLYPFKDIYMIRWGHLGTVVLFSIIGIAILVIACINFINLMTARSTRRAREVGIRKVVGAAKTQIMWQFFSEAILYTLLALLMAFLLVSLFIEPFRQLTGAPLKLDYAENTGLLFGILGIAIFTGLISGFHPAVFLSSFKPIRVLKSGLMTMSTKSSFRKSLVVIQFTVTIILLISTVVIYKQTHYMKYKELGFNKEQMMYIPLTGELRHNYETFKTEVAQHHAIKSLSLTSRSPIGIYQNGQNWQWQGRTPDVNPLVTYLSTDEDFMKTFQTEMADGDYYTPETGSSGNYVVINERFQEIMGVNSAVGQQLSKGPESYTILGVMKNFHFKPVDAAIGPLIIFYKSDWPGINYLFMRVDTNDLEDTIAFLKKTTKKLNPAFPFEFHFLNDDYARIYHSTEQLNRIISTFAFLAIFISCLGLFGLISFMTEQRTKEIGIRKAMGAHVFSIVSLLSKEFIKWIIIANLVAWPVAWLLMAGWLQNFAYKTSLSLWIFLVAGLAALLVALLTMSFQAIKAAAANPVEALRYE